MGKNVRTVIRTCKDAWLLASPYGFCWPAEETLGQLLTGVTLPHCTTMARNMTSWRKKTVPRSSISDLEKWRRKWTRTRLCNCGSTGGTRQRTRRTTLVSTRHSHSAAVSSRLADDVYTLSVPVVGLQKLLVRRSAVNNLTAFSVVP